MQSSRSIPCLENRRVQLLEEKVQEGKVADFHSHKLRGQDGDIGTTKVRTAGFVEVAGNRLDKDFSLHNDKFWNHQEVTITTNQ